MLSIYTVLFFCTIIANVVIQVIIKIELKKNGYGIDFFNYSDFKNFKILIKEEKDEKKRLYYTRLFWYQLISIFASITAFVLIVHNSVHG
jgi:hypothetical protein